MLCCLPDHALPTSWTPSSLSMANAFLSVLIAHPKQCCCHSVLESLESLISWRIQSGSVCSRYCSTESSQFVHVKMLVHCLIDCVIHRFNRTNEECFWSKCRHLQLDPHIVPLSASHQPGYQHSLRKDMVMVPMGKIYA